MKRGAAQVKQRRDSKATSATMRPSITPANLVSHGLDAVVANWLSGEVQALIDWLPAVAAWRQISQTLLTPAMPFGVHRACFDVAYANWNHNAGPPPAWLPTSESAAATNLGAWLRELGYRTFDELRDWSVRDRAAFWEAITRRVGIQFRQPYSQPLDVSQGVEHAEWFVGARLNIVDSCFAADPAATAIVAQNEIGPVRVVSYRELEALTNRVVQSLLDGGLRSGDAVAIDMPLTPEAVAIYLGTIKSGCVAVSIADSLAPQEVATRLRIGDARVIFTQDHLLRGGKRLPLYEKIKDAGAPPAVVLRTDNAGAVPLRTGDLKWENFLSNRELTESHAAAPDDTTNILFSSGTTGDPKAIPWTHTTPMKSATDAFLYQDVRSGDRVAWPTNLGWMMGPWVVYASLINRASMALYDGAPTGRDFGAFVQETGVTMLGVIPTLIKSWRQSECMNGLDWSRLRAFSSTGECSNADDMLYLMSLARYRPVVEYCGGTELGGGYLASTLVQPNALSAFSTSTLGTELVILDEEGHATDQGEVFLVPPTIGMSTRLLKGDHHQVYYADTPSHLSCAPLRRHGDALERLGGGYYRALGRVDDTMNLGGIKVSAVEVERVLNTVPHVQETAAVALSPPGGGPILLRIHVVMSHGQNATPESLRPILQEALGRQLNPLFKIHDVVLELALPRTASHKLIRRSLREP